MTVNAVIDCVLGVCVLALLAMTAAAVIGGIVYALRIGPPAWPFAVVLMLLAVGFVRSEME